MSLEGFLMLSSGDEIGQVNDYSYKEQPDLAEDSRNLHRSPFNWENAAKRKAPATVQGSVWEGLRQMETIRKEHPCFDRDARVTTWDTCVLPVFAIRRTAGDRELVCLANFSGEQQTVCLPTLYSEYQDLFTKKKLNLQSVHLAPYQYRWCERITG
jgi:amylosucrase